MLEQIIQQLETMPVLQQVYFGNSLFLYVKAMVLFFIISFVFKLVQWIIKSRLKAFSKKTVNHVDDTFVEMIGKINARYISIISLWFVFTLLQVHELLHKLVEVIAIVCTVVVVIRMLKVLIDYVAEKKFGKEQDFEPGIVQLIRQVSVGLLWLFGALLVLSNLGVDITSLLAGLGIGGIAVALALQTILTDLFSSFSIYFDKPFKVGDFIELPNASGTVEKIGIKTTRLRSLRGEEIVVPNRELTATQVNNFRKLLERHVFFNIGITYETSQKKLEQIPAMLEEIVGTVEGTKYDRSQLIELGDSALIFEVVYFVLSDDFTVYRERHAEVLLKINQRFNKEKIGFAYPTQTIYMGK